MTELNVELKDENSFQLMVLGDMHIGDELCDMDLIKDAIDYVKKNKDCYVILNGDLINNALKTSKSDYITYIINNIGSEMTSNDVDILISDFLTYNIITKEEAKLLKVATSDNVLKLDKNIKDEVRARIFKNMLLNIEEV